MKTEPQTRYAKSISDSEIIASNVSFQICLHGIRNLNHDLSPEAPCLRKACRGSERTASIHGTRARAIAACGRHFTVAVTPRQRKRKTTPLALLDFFLKKYHLPGRRAYCLRSGQPWTTRTRRRAAPAAAGAQRFAKQLRPSGGPELFCNQRIRLAAAGC